MSGSRRVGDEPKPFETISHDVGSGDSKRLAPLDESGERRSVPELSKRPPLSRSRNELSEMPRKQSKKPSKPRAGFGLDKEMDVIAAVSDLIDSHP